MGKFIFLEVDAVLVHCEEVSEPAVVERGGKFIRPTAEQGHREPRESAKISRWGMFASICVEVLFKAKVVLLEAIAEDQLSVVVEASV